MGNKLISYNKYVDFIQFSISRNKDCSLYFLVFIAIFISQTVRYKRKNEFIKIIIYQDNYLLIKLFENLFENISRFTSFVS